MSNPLTLEAFYARQAKEACQERRMFFVIGVILAFIAFAMWADVIRRNKITAE